MPTLYLLAGIFLLLIAMLLIALVRSCRGPRS